MMQLTEGRLVKWLDGDAWNVGCLLFAGEDEKYVSDDGLWHSVGDDDPVLVKPWPDGLPLFVRYGDLIEREVRAD